MGGRGQSATAKYFYNNVFKPDQNSKVQNRKKLNKKEMEILPNELLVLTKDKTRQ